MTLGQGHGPDPLLDHVRAETYLRLRAEAELRRVLALPRDDATNDDDEAEELTAEHGLRRHSVVAQALAQAGAIGRGVADSVTEELAAALFARSRVGGSDMADVLRPERHGQPARPPAGPYLAVPVGITLPGGPGSGLAEVQLFALVIAPDRAILTTAGRLRNPARKPVRGRRSHHAGLPFDGPETPTGTDDRGNSYTMYADSSSSDGDGNWTCLLSLSPIPQPGARWLELTMSPGSPPVRVDLASHGAGGGPAPGPAAAASPAERMVDTVAHRLLHASLTYPDDDVSWYDLSEIADIVTALDAVGALGAARGAVGRLVTLAGRLRVRIPPALSAVAQPAGLPAAWQNILENRDRGDGPTGLAQPPPCCRNSAAPGSCSPGCARARREPCFRRWHGVCRSRRSSPSSRTRRNNGPGPRATTRAAGTSQPRAAEAPATAMRTWNWSLPRPCIRMPGRSR